jgi:hypothetical protein
MKTKKNKVYSVRVHEKEFALISKNSALLKRLTEKKKKRDAWYARRAVNARARHKEERLYRENRKKQHVAVSLLNDIIAQRRPRIKPGPLDSRGVTWKGSFEEYDYEYCSAVADALVRSRLPRDANNKPQWHKDSLQFPHLSGRACKILHWLEIKRVNDWRRVTSEELLALPGFGERSVKKLIDGLKQFDITLGDLVPVEEQNKETPKENNANRDGT